MKITRALHLGMCFGVRDAIALAQTHAARGPITILGELVHNPAVLNDLASRGASIAEHPPESRAYPVMITAHGASDARVKELRSAGYPVLEATCPLVRVAHRALKQLVAEGFHPVVIGRRDHVEVRGMTGDYANFDVVLSEEDIASLKPKARFGVVAQTTQPIDFVREMVERMRSRFPEAEVRFIDTVCQPTKLRQQAAHEVGRDNDIVIVVGGLRSNNSQKLVETCRVHCDRVFLVQGPDDLQRTWFTERDRVGLTAGTSTPDFLIDSVEERLREFNAEFLHRKAWQCQTPGVVGAL